MSVYIDNARLPYGRMLMSHMIADTIEELDSMANRIGISHKWRQKGHYDICQSKRKLAHYDICQSKRKLAIAYGAISVSQREIVIIRRRICQFSF